MRRLSLLVFAAALVSLMQLPVAGQDKKKETPKDKEKAAAAAPACCPPGHSFKHLNDRPLIIVANGVGGSTHASDGLIEVNGDKQLGLRIHPISWSRQLSSFKDLVDNEAQLNAAARIACMVTAIRKDCPEMPIFLVGHSAGARVVLVAAEMLPDRSLDRVVLLAAAVSANYDLTGALRATRGGIDNFWSGDDATLDHAVDHVGTADGQRGPAAGRIGFRMICSDPKDIAAYRNLRQHRWNEDYCGSGGHYAWTLKRNIAKGVMPVFFAPNICEGPPPTVYKMPAAK